MPMDRKGINYFIQGLESIHLFFTLSEIRNTNVILFLCKSGPITSDIPINGSVQPGLSFWGSHSFRLPSIPNCHWNRCGRGLSSNRF